MAIKGDIKEIGTDVLRCASLSNSIVVQFAYQIKNEAPQEVRVAQEVISFWGREKNPAHRVW